MIHSCKLFLFLLVLPPGGLFSQSSNEKYPPEGFVYLHEAIPDIEYEIRYAGSNNFIGRPITGYDSEVALFTTEAAEALKKVQESVKKKGYRIKVFDAYRPQRAVNHFITWAKDPADTLMKNKYYPEIDKSKLFQLGYIASQSGHTRGSTIDLTLVDAGTGEELEMGSPYDFFGKISHHGADVSARQETNRQILRNAMETHGFRALPEEWWHYRLRNEPYPNNYFDFPVK